MKGGIPVSSNLGRASQRFTAWRSHQENQRGVDASGRFDPLPVTAMTRLAQAGVVLVTTGPLVLEMMADNTYPKGNEVYTALFSEPSN